MAGLRYNLPVLPVVFLLISAYIMPTVARWRPRLCAPLATVATAFSTLAAAVMAGQVITAGQPIYYNLGGWLPPWGIGLRVHYAEVFMLLVLNGVCLAVLAYMTADVSHELSPGAVEWYYTVFLLLLAAMIGITVTNDLFNLYVFMEVSGITACALVAAKGHRRSTLAAVKYLLLAAVGSGFVLFGIGMLYLLTGQLNVDFVQWRLTEVWPDYARVVWVAISFFTVGFGIKAALFPLHIWLPDAHSSAPSPSSAILSGLVVKVYAFAFLRLLHTALAGPLAGSPAMASSLRGILLGAAVLAVLGGSAFALVQREVKRLLAYSTVAQVGYIFLGVGLGTRGALAVALVHVLFHAVMKAGLFLAAGAVALRTGARYVDEYDGMGRRLPASMAVFTVCALSMIGLPGFSGLVTKWYLGVACLEAGYPWLVGVVVVSSLLNAVYYLPVLGRAYLGSTGVPAGEAPVPMLVPMLALAVLTIVFGLWPRWPLELVRSAAQSLVP
jgi:multicomponent Na+:H+ antiporter subunit D